jgi:F0F1-type ATP synthase delta subunit
MFKPFITALIYRILSFLQTNETFFTQSAEERIKSMETLKLPPIFKTYLGKISEKEFLRDLTLSINYSNEGKLQETNQNPFFLSLIDFFTKNFSMRMDIMNESYSFSDQKRQEIALKIMPGEGELAESLRHLLLHYSYQELANEIIKICTTVANAPLILIQSPREIDLSLKKEIRTKLLTEEPLAFLSFQINRKLIGGVRVFKGGKVVDHSWLSRVLRFKSLTSV